MAPTQAERTETTRAALIAAGRRLFGRHGFAEASIEDLAREAGMTRGALYHHFDSKEALFEAVFESVELELITSAGRAAAKANDAWASLLAGCRSFLEAASDAEVQRIVSIDGPSVLGWAKWREIEERYALGALRASLDAAAKQGFLRGRDTETLAYMLLGALTEATLVLGSGARPAKQVYREVEALLEALRTAGAPE
jgi:AcrR family transcriptional regulator